MPTAIHTVTFYPHLFISISERRKIITGIILFFPVIILISCLIVSARQVAANRIFRKGQFTGSPGDCHSRRAKAFMRASRAFPLPAPPSMESSRAQKRGPWFISSRWESSWHIT